MLRVMVAVLAPLAAAAAYGCSSQPGPSATTDSNIEEIRFGDIVYEPPCSPGIRNVDDQTDTVFSIGRGNAYTLDVTFGTCGGSYQGTGQAWIDWNQDEEFTEDEELGEMWSGSPVSEKAFDFVVPGDAATGMTVMRVMQREGSGSAPLDPCSLFSWGGTVDFSVEIGSGGGSGSGMSGGSVLLILVFVFVPLYIVAGCVYNRRQKGTTGMLESCPQNEMWMAFPSLVKDGCTYSLVNTKAFIAWARGKASGGDADGYDEL
mmetsp:Transcript_10011/g.11388  ORF Transcript_10011/g.11388 Transcript_10011/m.11388 type:complete len:261 (-) Transcript_10011:120-902(-)|eukprot:CAMPEP_0205831604 /NCGR_PEP_ID=MMETSP0206-20130828/44518_1 /ASSEMBLY_ACC=CAM_ASM_000279 /TAXON_ID=36767 /ORGANISM="Euplotes focardii, Strain TN1" /LENGTH=260 /DNA_ID=CAMNT_0053136387 /DNA_START=33 /DNA_END=815 /DNA_ORIENTATION=+